MATNPVSKKENLAVETAKVQTTRLPSSGLDAVIAKTIETLAAFEPSDFPVISLYLSAAPDSRGKDNFTAFLKKELYGRADTYELRSRARSSFEADIERIEKFLETQLEPSTN